jgi:hypothetical protein
MNSDLTAEADGQQVARLQGVVQKGPMLSGGTVTVAPLDEALNVQPALATTTTEDDLGTYQVELPFEGVVQVEARGLWFNELTGAAAGTPVTLRALAQLELGAGVQEVKVNALTQVCANRVIYLALGGMPLAQAQLASARELVLVLGVTPAGYQPTLPPEALDLALSEGLDHAFLAGFSGMLLQAASKRGGALDAKVQELLGQVAADFADGTLEATLLEELRQANKTLDSAGFRQRLSTWFGQVPGGPGETCADPDGVLDADFDGHANAEDNCPKAPNPLLTDTDDDGIGDICDACPITPCEGLCLPANGQDRLADLCHLPCQDGACQEAQTCLQSTKLCGPLGSCCVPNGEPGAACHDDQTCDGDLSCSPDDPSCPPPLNSCCK